MLKVGVVGASGYTGIELLNLLLGHSKVELFVVCSQTYVGQSVADSIPTMRGRTDLSFSAPTDPALEKCDLVFFATPKGVAMQQAARLLNAGVRVIDLSPDFRLRSAELWEQHYNEKHTAAELLDMAVYGLPELYRERIKGAHLVANPGCYPTAIILGLLPALKSGKMIPEIIADACSGASGAGRKTDGAMMFCEIAEDFRAYAASGHRHHPEMVEVITGVMNNTCQLTFVPHLLAVNRGMHATIHFKMSVALDLQSIYARHYQQEPFVEVLPSASHPAIRSLRGSNGCQIALHRGSGEQGWIVLSAIDNLLKGAAGQAVQNMNLMFGFGETTALQRVAIFP